jgi:MFS family permease
VTIPDRPDADVGDAAVDPSVGAGPVVGTSGDVTDEPDHQTFGEHWRSLPRVTSRLLLADGALALGWGLTLPFFWVYLHQARGMSSFVAGAVLAWAAAAGLVMAPFWGQGIDRFGPRPVWIVSLTMDAAGVFALAFVTQPWQAFAAATLFAAGGSGSWPAGTAMYARLVPSQGRAWLFGVRFGVINLGVGLGGLVAALFVRDTTALTFRHLYLFCVASTVVGVLVLLSVPRGTGSEPDDPDADDKAEPDVGYRQLIRDRVFVRLLLGGLVLVTFGYAQLESGLAAYVTQVADVQARWLGVSYGFNTATIVVAQLLVIQRIQGRSRTRLLSLVGVMWAVSWLVIGSSALTSSVFMAVAVLSVAGVCFGLGETLWAPLFPALVNDLAVESARGRYNAAGATVWNLSSIVGPLYAAFMIGQGWALAWVAVTTLGCLAGGGLMLTVRRHLTAEQDGREPTSLTGAVPSVR